MSLTIEPIEVEGYTEPIQPSHPSPYASKVPNVAKGTHIVMNQLSCL